MDNNNKLLQDVTKKSRMFPHQTSLRRKYTHFLQLWQREGEQPSIVDSRFNHSNNCHRAHVASKRHHLGHLLPYKVVIIMNVAWRSF
jgi:hypothetical protein